PAGVPLIPAAPVIGGGGSTLTWNLGDLRGDLSGAYIEITLNKSSDEADDTEAGTELTATVSADDNCGDALTDDATYQEAPPLPTPAQNYHEYDVPFLEACHQAAGVVTIDHLHRFASPAPANWTDIVYSDIFTGAVFPAW